MGITRLKIADGPHQKNRQITVEVQGGSKWENDTIG